MAGVAKSIGVNINNQPVQNMGMSSVPGERSQRDKRLFAGEGGDLPPFTDQHDRKFEAWCDVDTLQPVEELRCISHSPPWLPPPAYARFGRKGQTHFAWQYRALCRNLAGETARWYQDARQFAQRNHLEVPEVGGKVDSLIADVKGYPPQSPEIALSAEAGEPWVLGVPNAPTNEDLQALIVQGRTGNARDALAMIEARVRAKIGPAVFGGTDPLPGQQAPVLDEESVGDPRAELEAIVAEMVENRMAAAKKEWEVEAARKLAAKQAQAAKARAAKKEKASPVGAGA